MLWPAPTGRRWSSCVRSSASEPCNGLHRVPASSAKPVADSRGKTRSGGKTIRQSLSAQPLTFLLLLSGANYIPPVQHRRTDTPNVATLYTTAPPCVTAMTTHPTRWPAVTSALPAPGSTAFSSNAHAAYVCRRHSSASRALSWLTGATRCLSTRHPRPAIEVLNTMTVHRHDRQTHAITFT